jgi:pyruvate/2-oxoglutarate/acetoin dehydrogenase E1 component
MGNICMHLDTKEITYIEAIREAFEYCLERDDSVIIVGEGVPDPKSIFGSTKGLQDKFGNKRIFDMPLAENGMTGICIGAAIAGLKPVLVHQRIDFALLSLDQIINNAAKWRYMFNNNSHVPIVIRMIVGRGWGQGPQHSQSLQALFAHIPGLKVVMPATPNDAKQMLISAINDPDPVIFIEHRWLHNIKGPVGVEFNAGRLDRANILREGKDITICCISYMVVEGLIAQAILMDVFGVSVELIDVRSVNPIDFDTLLNSVMRTGRVIIADTGHQTAGISAELIATISTKAFDYLTARPERICSPDYPAPTGFNLTSEYYPGPRAIVLKALEMLGIEPSSKQLLNFSERTLQHKPHDVPYSDFSGPF